MKGFNEMENLTLAELREQAKQLGIPSVTKDKKGELSELIDEKKKESEKMMSNREKTSSPKTRTVSRTRAASPNGTAPRKKPAKKQRSVLLPVMFGMAVAFAMCPTSIEDLMSIANSGRIMPPKSTWFEPKLLSGIFIHELK